MAAVFAFVVLSTGLFSSERSKETVYAGLEKTRGTMELSGAVVATSDGTEVTDLAFDVTLAAGGSAVNWDPAATTNRTIVSYIDDSSDHQRPGVHADVTSRAMATACWSLVSCSRSPIAGLAAQTEINENDTFTLAGAAAVGFVHGR